MLPDAATLLAEITAEVQPLLPQGELPHYIPKLAKVNKAQFGIALVCNDGAEFIAGSADTRFSIQSISKLFSLMLALERMGDALWNNVGREPSGMPFNELILVDQERGATRNPFINAGALVISDVLCSRFAHPEIALLQELRRNCRDESVEIDEEIMQSERGNCHRNAAIAHLLKSYGRINCDVDKLLDTYCRQCALSMSCRQIARSLLSLSMDGPVDTGLTATQRHIINTLMLTCGTYNASGEFAARVGLPLKSGVGGGIAAVIPGVGVLCAWSPGLDIFGNSLAAGRAIELFVQRTGLSLLGIARTQQDCR